ncbi:DEAD-box ATP-dependent RNA helicase 37-like [Impatiens glandulifera]|uniref:DEAD-box ATP-dependent RNA helicase 37-like n=1 Tax=Impatiens glandulifera TaxID=253017 RepID=UPI001FB19292|nr:DEAD-box ATP-dependent RNA helicase 37-like [Impatiens glandulifera]
MAATDSMDASEGPVLNFINKRLRALRKKQNRILQIEDSLAQGKAINKEQEDLIRSKVSISASIDELERLRQPLAAAVAEEITLALHRHRHQESASPSDTTADPLDDKEEKEEEEEHQTADAEAQKEVEENRDDDSIVEDLLNLLYFGMMFDVKSQNDFTSMMLTRTHERGCCLTYDYVTDDESADLLVDMDLDSISRLSGLLISRPTDSVLSHKNALQKCVENAKRWLASSDEPIDSIPNTTYAGLRAKLSKIMASHYFTTTPEMKATVVMAAAAAGNYGSFQVGATQEYHVPLNVSTLAEIPNEQQYQEEADSSNIQGNETYSYESNPVEESQKEYQDDSGEVRTKEELIKSETEDENQRVGESKEDQQYAQRRSYQNQRGGGGGRRGGYSSGGRGGRGSGRGGGSGGGSGNQFFDQSGNYYPRSYYVNNNNRPRGGRGGGGAAAAPGAPQTRSYVQADA